MSAAVYHHEPSLVSVQRTILFIRVTNPDELRRLDALQRPFTYGEPSNTPFTAQAVEGRRSTTRGADKVCGDEGDKAMSGAFGYEVDNIG